MKEVHCNYCGREFDQRDYDKNCCIRLSHDTQSNQAYQAELCCDCIEQLATRYMEEAPMATTHENKTICATCGKAFETTHSHQFRITGIATKIGAHGRCGHVCDDCFDSRAARFAEACRIKPKAVPWINLEMCAWLKDVQKKVNPHD